MNDLYNRMLAFYGSLETAVLINAIPVPKIASITGIVIVRAVLIHVADYAAALKQRANKHN